MRLALPGFRGREGELRPARSHAHGGPARARPHFHAPQAARTPGGRRVSDRLVRMAHIAALAQDVLGQREKAGRWLQKPNRVLGGSTPLEHLDTELGARQVEQILGRIAHGVLS